MNLLFLDLTEEFISTNFDGKHSVSNIQSEQVFENPKDTGKELKAYLKDKEITAKDTVFTIGIKDLNYQVVALPEDIPDKDKHVLLGLEIDPFNINKRHFNFQKLPVTKRVENEEEVCDYIVISIKPKLHPVFELFAKEAGLKVSRVVPSFFIHTPNRSKKLTVSAWVGNDRTELALWGQNNPLALSVIPNAGDQMGDINRFVANYFDQFAGLDIEDVSLYGPRMRDESITFSLSYPNQIIEDPRLAIAKNLPHAKDLLDISVSTKLPRPPLEMNPRNIGVIAAGVIGFVLLLVSSFFYIDNLALGGKLSKLRVDFEKNRTLSVKSKKMNQEKRELNQEKEFYLNITKRRTPWHNIFTDLATMTPKNLWLERFSSSKASIQLAGKATTPESVSDYSINFNNSSTYFKDAQLIGVRDLEQEQRKYAEFQMLVKLKSPKDS